MSDVTNRVSRRAVLKYAAVLGAGISVGGAFRANVHPGRVAGAATPGAADATATREAELKELDDLRTQVANPPVCTPAPTETPVPASATATEVPLAQTGVPLPYLEIWTITVLGIAPTPGGPEAQPDGQFMQVNLTISHSSQTPETLLLPHFVLVDDNGRFSSVDIAVNQKFFGPFWSLSLEPGLTETRSVVFDVAADAGESFILESNADPVFRVALKVEQRG